MSTPTASRWLDHHGVMHEVKNHGHHLIVHHRGRSYDLWPSRWKWRERPNGSMQRGVEGFARAVNLPPPGPTTDLFDGTPS